MINECLLTAVDAGEKAERIHKYLTIRLFQHDLPVYILSLGLFPFFYNSTGIKNQSPLFGKVRDKPICVSVTGAIQATAQFTLPRLRCLRGVA